MKKTISILLALMLTMSFVLTGCGNEKATDSTSNDSETSSSSETSNSSETSTSDEQKTLTIWWAEQDKFKAPLLEAIRAFEAENPNVTIEIEWTPNFDIYEKYKIALVGGEAPDIVKIDHVFVQTLGYNDKILDLTQFGANDVKDQFIQSTWAANMYKDAVYALPFDANTLALMYNKDLLDEAGVQPPTTLEELITASQAVNALGKEGVHGYTIPFDPGASGFLSFQFNGWIARNGGSVLNDDWSASTINSPEVINAIYQLKSLIDTDAAPANVFMEGDFYAGKVGMLEMGPWHVPTITKEDAPANFGVVPTFGLAEGIDTYAPLGLYSLAISGDTKYPQEAYDFVEFLATSEAMHISYSKATNLMPSLISAYENEFYNDETWQMFIKQLESTVSRPGSPAWPEIDQIINDMLQEVLLDVATPEEAAAKAEEKINEAIAGLE